MKLLHTHCFQMFVQLHISDFLKLRHKQFIRSGLLDHLGQALKGVEEKGGAFLSMDCRRV